MRIAEIYYSGREFLLTPLREGRQINHAFVPKLELFLLTPLREGRLERMLAENKEDKFLLTPLREGRQQFSTSPS